MAATIRLYVAGAGLGDGEATTAVCCLENRIATLHVYVYLEWRHVPCKTQDGACCGEAMPALGLVV